MPQTVKFTLVGPYAPLLSYLDLGIVPKSARRGGHDIGSEAGRHRADEARCAGRAAATIELEANPDLLGRRAQGRQGDRLKIIGDNTARAPRPSRPATSTSSNRRSSPQDITRLEADSRFGHVVAAGLGVTYLNFNTKDPLLADPRMRKAFAMLVDQQSIVGDIYQGVDQAATSITPAVVLGLFAGYQAAGLRCRRAPRAARRARLEGQRRDGILEKDGKPS